MRVHSLEPLISLHLNIQSNAFGERSWQERNAAMVVSVLEQLAGRFPQHAYAIPIS